MKASELKALITKYSKIDKWEKRVVKTMAEEYALIVMKAPVENVGSMSDFKQIVNKPVTEKNELETGNFKQSGSATKSANN